MLSKTFYFAFSLLAFGCAQNTDITPVAADTCVEQHALIKPVHVDWDFDFFCRHRRL